MLTKRNNKAVGKRMTLSKEQADLLFRAMYSLPYTPKWNWAKEGDIMLRCLQEMLFMDTYSDDFRVHDMFHGPPATGILEDYFPEHK